MKLSIPLNSVPIEVISPCSHNARILPLPDMKGGSNIGMWVKCLRMRIKIPVELYKLFCPIDCYSYSKRNQHTTENWMSENESMNGFDNARYRKEMAPNKLQRFLCFSQNWLRRVHHFSPYFYDQASTKFIKNTPEKTQNISKPQHVCQLFNTKSIIEGGRTHES